MVAGAAPQNGPGQSKNAQFRNIEAPGRRVEITHRRTEASIHRRGKTIAVSAVHWTLVKMHWKEKSQKLGS